MTLFKGGLGSRALALAIAATTVVGSAPAAAQTLEATTEVQIENFEPMPGLESNILNVAQSSMLPHLGLTFGLMFHYQRNPMEFFRRTEAPDAADSDVPTDPIIESMAKGEIWAGIGLWEYVEIGLVMPLVFNQTGGSDPDIATVFGADDETLSGFTVGDMRIVPKGRFWDPEDMGGFGVALALPMWIPTGEKTTFNSDGVFRVEPRLIVDWRHEIGFAIAANLGYQIRDARQVYNVTVNDVLRWGAAFRVELGMEELRLVSSAFGTVALDDGVDPLNPDNELADGRGSPAELLGGLEVDLPFNLQLHAGGGGGLTRGLGAPDWRVYATVLYSDYESLGDRDGDGLLDNVDRCPDDPEDHDEFEDEDGCPDPDNDGDRVPDVKDAPENKPTIQSAWPGEVYGKCMNEPEDMDGFEDEDGCPDPDNDKDTIPDLKDNCPNNPEDWDGFEDEDGCPDPDNDGDQVPDVSDAPDNEPTIPTTKPDAPPPEKFGTCMNEPEDMDGFEDEDGCPDPDNDQDKIPDLEDACPNNPGPPSDNPRFHGCPEVAVERCALKVRAETYFARGKARLSKAGKKILSKVAAVLNEHPEFIKIRIEGHTSARQPWKKNMRLSKKRAKAVYKFLTKKGKVAKERIEWVGYGESRPVKPNYFHDKSECKGISARKLDRREEACHDEPGLAQNRRTELWILELRKDDGTVEQCLRDSDRKWKVFPPNEDVKW